jgi:hypothetical protein
MNASGDKRYRRCKGLSDNFGKVKEESAGSLGLFVEGFEDDDELIDSRREKLEGGGDD